MKRYWEVYRILLRNSLIREMSFKANFLLWIIVELCWFAGQLLFIEVLYSHVDAIGDWTKWQMVLLIATHQLIGQLFQAFFYVNIANLPELVRTGKLDFLLLQPIDAQFATSTRLFGFDNLVNAALSGCIVGFSLWKLGITPGAVQVVSYLAALVCGVAIHYALMMTLASVSFWMIRVQGVLMGYFSVVSLARYPDTIFRGGLRWVLSWVLPVILIANVPARFLMGTQTSSLAWLHLLAAAFLVLAFTRLFWKFAVTRYGSASS